MGVELQYNSTVSVGNYIAQARTTHSSISAHGVNIVPSHTKKSASKTDVYKVTAIRENMHSSLQTMTEHQGTMRDGTIFNRNMVSF